MTPFWWTNDFGEALNISQMSGATLGRFLHEAVTRAVERRAAMTLKGEAGGADGAPGLTLGEGAPEEGGSPEAASPLAEAWSSGRVFGASGDRLQEQVALAGAQEALVCRLCLRHVLDQGRLPRQRLRRRVDSVRLVR